MIACGSSSAGRLIQLLKIDLPQSEGPGIDRKRSGAYECQPGSHSTKEKARTGILVAEKDIDRGNRRCERSRKRCPQSGYEHRAVSDCQHAEN